MTGEEERDQIEGIEVIDTTTGHLEVDLEMVGNEIEDLKIGTEDLKIETEDLKTEKVQEHLTLNRLFLNHLLNVPKNWKSNHVQVHLLFLKLVMLMEKQKLILLETPKPRDENLFQKKKEEERKEREEEAAKLKQDQPEVSVTKEDTPASKHDEPAEVTKESVHGHTDVPRTYTKPISERQPRRDNDRDRDYNKDRDYRGKSDNRRPDREFRPDDRSNNAREDRGDRNDRGSYRKDDRDRVPPPRRDDKLRKDDPKPTDQTVEVRSQNIFSYLSREEGGE